MKLSVISDMHLGYASGSEREEDSFLAASEAIQKSKAADAIIIAGDIFDTKTPSTETLVKVMRMFSHSIMNGKGASIEAFIGKEEADISPMHLSGMPVIAIHGTHERRVKGLLNPVQAMERAGFLVHLHCNGVVLKKGNERVCIQGISGVPDQYAESVIKECSPKPVKGCFNILMLHQSVSPFMYAKHMLDASRLPDGFDLYILGHIHEAGIEDFNGKRILIAGSTVTTQLTKDSVRPNGFWEIDAVAGGFGAKFTEIRRQRKIFIKDASKCQSNRDIEGLIEGILSGKSFEMKPIIRLELPAKHAMPREIKSKFSDRAIIYFKKRADETGAPEGKPLEEHRLSVQELGKKIMKENFESFGLDPKTFSSVFELVINNKNDQVIELLRDRNGRRGDNKESGQDSKA